jgi:hypothetical protein
MPELPERFTINRPVRFGGTEAERDRNFRTHDFHASGDPEDGDVRCWRCDCKPWHAAASYPCGEEPPRETIEVGG